MAEQLESHLVDVQDDVNRDAVCEACDRDLYAGVDEWEEQPAQDADGVTTFTICCDCIEGGE